MSISRNNYEFFLIDFLEGTLPAEDHARLFDFLAQHSDLKEEFALLNNPIEKEAVPIMDKTLDFNFLKKSCEDWVADEELIALMEQDLAGEAKEIVEKKLAIYPANNKRYELFLQTKFNPELHIFPHKSDLKKRETKIIPLYVRWAVAASLLAFAFIGLWSTWNPTVAPLAEVSDAPVSANNSIEPIKESPLKVLPASINKPVVVLKNTPEIALLKLKENTLSIAPKAIKNLPIASTEMFEPIFESAGLLAVKIVEPVKADAKFLTPGDFVMQQIKKEITKGYVGFSFHEEVDPEAQVKRYGFISKYFAYERIIQTN